MYSPRDVANAFFYIAREDGQRLTNMQLQKLVYFAHGWNLALTGKPLINEPVMAWTFGPVIPTLYDALRQYGNGQVVEPIQPPGQDIDHEFSKRLLERIWQVYGGFDGMQLSTLTHRKGSPWAVTWKHKKFSVIPDSLLREYFHKQRAPDNAE